MEEVKMGNGISGEIWKRRKWGGMEAEMGNDISGGIWKWKREKG
jgi:hypothetical protein